MAEAGLFDAVVVDRAPVADTCIDVLIWWAARFAELGWTPSYGPGDHGNLSCRTPRGLMISARETSKATLRPDQFIEVTALDQTGPRPRATCRGLLLPSTDTLLHWRVYQLRPDVNAILHGHDKVALANAHALNLPITSVSAAQPSMALVDDACRLAAKHDYILLRDHGFLVLGGTADEAGELARDIAVRARSAG